MSKKYYFLIGAALLLLAYVVLVIRESSDEIFKKAEKRATTEVASRPVLETRTKIPFTRTAGGYEVDLRGKPRGFYETDWVDLKPGEVSEMFVVRYDDVIPRYTIWYPGEKGYQISFFAGTDETVPAKTMAVSPEDGRGFGRNTRPIFRILPGEDCGKIRLDLEIQ